MPTTNFYPYIRERIKDYPEKQRSSILSLLLKRDLHLLIACYEFPLIYDLFHLFLENGNDKVCRDLIKELEDYNNDFKTSYSFYA